MNAEEALVAAMQLQQEAWQQERAQLVAEQTRLRELLATYPAQQQTMLSVLVEMREALWQLSGTGGVTRRVMPERDWPSAPEFPPAPEMPFWPTDTGPQPVVPGPVRTQVEIPDDVGSTDEESG